MTKVFGQLQVGDLRLQPGEEWPVPAGSWRFARLHSGVAYWIGAEIQRSLAPNEVLVAGPECDGIVRASQLTPVLLNTFHFFPGLFSGFFSVAERHQFETVCARAFKEVRFFPSSHPVAQQFATRMAESLSKPSLVHRAELLGCVVSIFDDGSIKHRPEKKRVPPTQRRFQEIIFQMTDNELLAHTAEALALLCGCSTRHFSRLFRQHFGVSARQRQSELRLMKAAQLLAGTRQGIAVVAQSSGYRNISLFNAMFKKRFRMTPSEWRDRAANNRVDFFSPPFSSSSSSSKTP
jgi:AraC-like DNA-binding protein